MIKDKLKIGGETFYLDQWYTTATEARAEANRLRKHGFKVRTVRTLADQRYARYTNYTRPSTKAPLQQSRKELTRGEITELINLYHLAKVVEDTRYKRLLWAAKEFHKKHPDVTSTRAYIEVGYATRL